MAAVKNLVRVLAGVAIGAPLVRFAMKRRFVQRKLNERAKAIRTSRAITIHRPPEEVYRFWRDFRNLARFMPHVEEIEIVDQTRSRWRAKTAAGKLRWDAQIVGDRPGERIEWTTTRGADLPHAGIVTFRPAPGGRGTELTVEMHVRAAGGKVVRPIAEQQMETDLRRLKAVMETGDVIRTDGKVRA